MTEKDTTVRYTLSEIKEQIAHGESQTRENAPEAQPIDKAFWEQAQVVMPSGKQYETMNESALDKWRRKLAFLQKEEAIAADPSLKFQLQEQIEECRQKIAELEGTESVRREDTGAKSSGASKFTIDAKGSTIGAIGDNSQVNMNLGQKSRE
jgi:DNA-binding transcriptional MerR regulator